MNSESLYGSLEIMPNPGDSGTEPEASRVGAILRYCTTTKLKGACFDKK